MGTPIVVVRRRVTAVVNVGQRGPQGESGIDVSARGLTFLQASPATTWTVNHNLGRKPSISVFSVGGVEIEAYVLHTSDNQALISFNSATAGSARIV